MEQRLQGSGQPCLIVRAGDFFGLRPGSSWFSPTLVKPGQNVTSVTYPGKRVVGHSWAYLLDASKTFAALIAREQDLPACARFHFAGHWDGDGTMMAKAIGRAIGRPDIRVKSLPWLLFAALAPFYSTLKEMLEMKPFWRAAVKLDNTALTDFLRDEPHTALDVAVTATLKGLGIPA